MKLEKLLSKDEGKTLEFKENSRSLAGIIKTVVAFANTAGGIIVIGVEDRTKKITGVNNALAEEERLTSAISDSIAPQLVPDIAIQTYREKELILINVPHMAGPYYIKSAGPEQGAFVRFGSTNRAVDHTMLESLKLFAKNISFDELPYFQKKTTLDWDFIKNIFAKVRKKVTKQKAEDLELITKRLGRKFPSHGGIILFGADRTRIFPDAIIRCARFQGTDKAKIIDSIDIESYPVVALEEAVKFIERNTAVKSEIGRIYRTDIPEYPPLAVREAIINSIVHTDYSIKRAFITIAIFADRMEITSPGGLTFGQTLQKALTGSSVIRNGVIARVFQELKLIERWGSGLQRIIDACRQKGLEQPLFEERENEFRVTLYNKKSRAPIVDEPQQKLIEYLKKKEKITTKKAAQLWDISPRNAIVRLKQLVEVGLIKKIGTSITDPHGGYILVK